MTVLLPLEVVVENWINILNCTALLPSLYTFLQAELVF